MKIGFDTCTLSSLIKLGEKDTASKVQNFLYNNINGELEITISNIVYAEILAHATKEEIAELDKLLNKVGNITYLPFNKKSAITNANLVKEMGLSDFERGRQAVKSDFLIISDNIAYGCNIFLTADKNLVAKMSKNIPMKVIDINTLPESDKNLFGEFVPPKK